MRLLCSFLVRDFIEQTSYRLAFGLSLFRLFFNIFIFYFISQVVGENVAPELARYNTDYFSFIVIGIAFNGYLSVGLHSFSDGLRQAQNSGTLEAMIMTPAPLAGIILGSAFWSYTFATFQAAIFLGMGFLLGADFSQANWLTGSVSFVLSLILYASLGIMAAGIIAVIKRGDPITSLVTQLATLFGGVYFPIEVLPSWLQPISKLVPVTYALEAMRLSLLKGASFAELRTGLFVLAILCLFFFPLSLFIFRLAIHQARKDGSLTHY